MQKFKMHGFKFPVGLFSAKLKVNGQALPNFDGLAIMDEESFSPVPASAWAVYISLLSKCDDKGIIRHDFKLSDLASLLNLSYNTIYAGFRYLSKHNYVYEDIINNVSVYVINNYEKYNKVEELTSNNQLNYFIVPFSLFETNILAEFVRTSNARAIKFMLDLFNRFRISIINKKSLESAVLPYKMTTLKKKLNKNAKGVRCVLEMLAPLFNIRSKGLHFRGEQVWINSYEIALKADCVRENTDEFRVEGILAKYRKELTYFLDNQGVKHRLKDLKDVMIAFKQEVVDLLNYMDEDQQRNKFFSNVFLESLENIQSELEQGKKLHTIGAYFRVTFRNQFARMVKNLPRGIIHQTIYEEYVQSGELPLLKAKQIF